MGLVLIPKRNPVCRIAGSLALLLALCGAAPQPKPIARAPAGPSRAPAMDVTSLESLGDPKLPKLRMEWVDAFGRSTPNLPWELHARWSWVQNPKPAVVAGAANANGSAPVVNAAEEP